MILKKQVHVFAPGAFSILDLSHSNLASHRLRLAVAAKGYEDLQSGSVTVGDNLTGNPDTLLVGKIGAQQIETRAPFWLEGMEKVENSGGRVILDYTDNHLTHHTVMTPFYERALYLAHQIVVPSEGMRTSLPEVLRPRVVVIPDALEYVPVPPRQTSTRKGVWFGHGSNLPYLIDYFQKKPVAKYFEELTICSDSATLAALLKSSALRAMPTVKGVVWSVENQRIAILRADFCFLPVGANDQRKSGAGPNRLMTSLCLGVPVFTQRLDSYSPFIDCFVDIDSPRWPAALGNLSELRRTVEYAQKKYVANYTPASLLSRWKALAG